MSGVFVLGEEVQVRGFSLAGATVKTGATAEELSSAFDEIDDDTALLILTSTAAELIGDRLEEKPWVVWTVIPR